MIPATTRWATALTKLRLAQKQNRYCKRVTKDASNKLSSRYRRSKESLSHMIQQWLGTRKMANIRIKSGTHRSKWRKQEETVSTTRIKSSNAHLYRPPTRTRGRASSIGWWSLEIIPNRQAWARRRTRSSFHPKKTHSPLKECSMTLTSYRRDCSIRKDEERWTRS